jgi:putative chitinase
MTVKLTTDILIAGCGASSTLAGQWLDAIQAAIDEQGISNSPSNTAAFLANVGVESQGLSTLVENLNYSAQRLAQVWPQRYAVNAFVDNKIPNDTAVRIAATGPQAIANNVYANRMGNGDENSGDGWRFRGQGLIQLTGRTNILAFFARADLPLNTDPSELQTTQLGAASAADFFVNSGAGDFGAQGNFDATVKAVNGALPCPANQGSVRQARYAAVLPLCSAANTPAKTPKAKTQTTPPAPQ